MEDIDIWRSAQILVRQHGEDAVDIAADRFTTLVQLGDRGGAAVWIATLTAILELRRLRRREAIN